MLHITDAIGFVRANGDSRIDPLRRENTHHQYHGEKQPQPIATQGEHAEELELFEKETSKKIELLSFR